MPARRALGLLAALILLPSPGRAAQRPRASALRIDPAEAPRIDGDLSDPVWAKAPPIGPLVQVEPVEGAAPSEETVVRVAHDGANLYVGILCRDREPSRIVGGERRRDARLDSNDRIEFVLDTFLDRRNAYFFQIGATGGRGDALMTNNGSNFNKAWDGIWDARSAITAEGWSAEFEIPFATLAFDPATTVWGFNVERTIKRREEANRWAGLRQNLSLFRISEAGDLEGMEGLEQGLGLDLVPYALGRVNRTHEPRDLDLTGEVGGDAFWHPSPSVTATVTVNTDFAQTEVDEQIVNLERFSLFFPEKRRFFLEDASIFDFETGGRMFRPRDFLPFFSRRIGLDPDGNPVPILAGARVTGRESGWEFGGLAVETEAKHGLDREALFVGRVRRNLGERSVLGAIGTFGDPASEGENGLLGFDYKFTTSEFLDDRNLSLSAFGLGTWSEGSDDHPFAYGAVADYPNDVWRARLGARVVQDDFSPALGFVRRPGTRLYDGAFSWNPRPQTSIRQLEFGVEPRVFTDTSGEAETVEVEVTPLGIEWDSGDEARVFVRPTYERLDEDFDILDPDGVDASGDEITIPEDSYSFVRAGIRAESASKRPVSVEGRFEFGDFFDGRRTDLEGEVTLRPGGIWIVGGEYEINRLELDDGDFSVQTARLRTEINFSTEVSLETLTQYDNVSDTVGINSRFHWILRPGRDLFLVLNHGWAPAASGGHAPERTEFIAKLSYTFRF